MSARDIFKEQVDPKILDKLYTVYRATVRVNGLLVGGIPSNPSVIKSWLTARMDMGDAALEELLEQTISERDPALGAMSTEEKVEALAKSSVAPSINGFKRTQDGFLAYEGRCAKAALREASNSAFPGTDYFGKKDAPNVSPRKGLMSTMVERIFVPELLISTGVHTEKDKVESENEAEPGKYYVDERVKHVMTAQGPRSAINLVEVIVQPTLSFTVKVHDDFLPPETWARIWTRLEDIGIGSDRGRSDGSFELLEWEKAS